MFLPFAEKQTLINFELVSRPQEPPLQPLAEPYVNVSAHTAPIIPPRKRLYLNYELLPFRVDP